MQTVLGRESLHSEHAPPPSFCVMLRTGSTNVGSVERQEVLFCSLASHTRKSTCKFSTDSTGENLPESTQGLDLSIHSSI